MIRRILNYKKYFGLKGILTAIRTRIFGKNMLVEVSRDNIKHPFYLRSGTTDIPTFKQIFIDDEYDFSTRNLPEEIIDAGANIGLSAIYFANKFPNAKIIAIEPEISNFELLQKNAQPYDNITCIRAAVWNKNTTIEIIDPGLGKWGFMTSAKNEYSTDKSFQEVESLTIDSILTNFELDKVDILKMDIEGAEKEVFQHSSAWIDKVKSMIVELHERMKPGCNRSFYNGTAGFSDEWIRGENIYLSKNNFLLQSSR